MVHHGKAVQRTIPTLNATGSAPQYGYDPLFALWSEVVQGNTSIVLDFSGCRFLQQHAVAFLGGLARLAAQRSSLLVFEWQTLEPRINTYLQKNGFMSAFAGGSYVRSDTAVPYREDRVGDKQGLMAYLLREWLGSGRIQLSDRLRHDIVGKVSEIFDNAFAHSASPVGVISCGQHYPNMKQLQLTVVDFGVGIPDNVRKYRRSPHMSASQTLKWAFTQGNTTSPGMGRGLGLDLLKDFVRLNQGALDVFSDQGHVRISGDGETFEDRTSGFGGTLVNLMLQCDEQVYQRVDEAQDGPLF